MQLSMLKWSLSICVWFLSVWLDFLRLGVCINLSAPLCSWSFLMRWLTPCSMRCELCFQRKCSLTPYFYIFQIGQRSFAYTNLFTLQSFHIESSRTKCQRMQYCTSVALGFQWRPPLGLCWTCRSGDQNSNFDLGALWMCSL